MRAIALGPRPVADIYRELLATLHELGLEVKIHPTPNELPDALKYLRPLAVQGDAGFEISTDPARLAAAHK